MRPHVIADGGLARVFVDSCIADITSLALVTLEMVDDFLFVYQSHTDEQIK